MKKRNYTMIAALALVCFLAELAPIMLDTAGLAWIKWDSLVGRHGFYFKKRQWLADLRTVLAAVRYLYASEMASANYPMNMVNNPPLPPAQTHISTNLLGLNGAESLLLPVRQELLRSGPIEGRKGRLSPDPAPPMSAVAGRQFDGLLLGRDSPVWV